MESSFSCCHAVETLARQWIKVTKVAAAEEALGKRQPFLNKYDVSFNDDFGLVRVSYLIFGPRGLWISEMWEGQRNKGQEKLVGGQWTTFTTINMCETRRKVVRDPNIVLNLLCQKIAHV